MPYDGTGVGIVVLDSGIDPNHLAFKDGSNASRIVYKQDFTGEGRTDDPYGHGTHVASLAAGNGTVSGGAYKGIAPNARIINLRVLNAQGRGTVSTLLAALEWVLANRNNAAYNIKVVNMSLGTAAIDSYENDPLCRAARALVDAGVVVVAAAGNEGKDSLGNKLYGQIHSPGNDPSVITVGAANTFGTDARTDDGVASYSSRGPTRSFWTDSHGVKHYDNLIKPDLVAPGNKLIAAEGVGNLLVTQNPHLDAGVSPAEQKKMMYLSGTSMATPVAAGAAALLLQANPQLTPNLVKMILMYTAQPLAGFNQFEQGAGQLNVEGAVRLARLVRTDLTNSTPVGSPLLSGPAPAPWTTLAGHTFGWSQGLIMDQTFASGPNLMTKYQGVYGTGVLLTDGTFEADGVLLTDGVLMSDGVLLSDSILTGSGVTIDEGIVFMDAGVLLGGGVLLTDGRVFGDGVLVSDAVLVGDGVLMGDRVQGANSALVGGEDTACMPPVADY
jgi:subtilisin family serine protease